MGDFQPQFALKGGVNSWGCLVDGNTPLLRLYARLPEGENARRTLARYITDCQRTGARWAKRAR